MQEYDQANFNKASGHSFTIMQQLHQGHRDDQCWIKVMWLAPDWAELEVQLWEDDSSGAAGILRATTRVPLKDSFWQKGAGEELKLQMEHAAGPGVRQITAHLNTGCADISQPFQGV